MVKKDGMILEKRLDDFRNQNPFSIRKDFQIPSIPHVSYPSLERLAVSVGMRQSIPSDSSKIEIPLSASG